MHKLFEEHKSEYYSKCKVAMEEPEGPDIKKKSKVEHERSAVVKL